MNAVKSNAQIKLIQKLKNVIAFVKGDITEKRNQKYHGVIIYNHFIFFHIQKKLHIKTNSNKNQPPTKAVYQRGKMKNKYKINNEYAIIFAKNKDKIEMEVLIDIDYLQKLLQHKGTVILRENVLGNTYYAAITKNYQKLFLHRTIVDCPGNLHVDHINHNTLDNRKINLRIVDRFENQQNRIDIAKNNRSGYRGVYWKKDKNKWAAQIRINNKNHHLGYFDNVLEAAQVATEGRKKLMPFSIN